VWFGAHHPNALRRAVQLGDAFMGAGSIGTAPFAEEVRLLRSMLEAAGRDPATFPIGKRVYLAVDADRGRAAKRLGEWFGAFYGRPEMAEQVSVWGDAQACVDALQAVIAAGARSLLLNPVFDEAEQMERLAEIAPKLTV
jgi:alkanesulfonate monooxygenase SsuD/methylene tetrahydromethanopterin reductase-like flavin-dependent oxidoreductase (luciferase family)